MNEKKKIFLKSPAFIAVVAVLAVAIGFVCVKEISSEKKKSGSFNIENSTSFFLKNNDGKYALFSRSGKQLTEFEYTSASEFINGYAIVRQGNSYAVLSESGKITIPFDSYKSIKSETGMFKVTDNDYHSSIVDGKGKLLYGLEKANLQTYIGVDYYSIYEDENNKTYKLLDYKGKELLGFSKNDSSDSPSTNGKNGVVAVSYGGKVWVLNYETGKEIASFNDNNTYCPSYVSDDKSVIELVSCVGAFQTQDKTYIKLVSDGKVKDVTDSCTNLSFYDNVSLCLTPDRNLYTLDKNFKNLNEVSNSTYVDSNKYAKNASGSFNGVDFYDGNKVINHVDCLSMNEHGYASNGLYILSTFYSKTCNTNSGSYLLYNSNGEKVVDKSFKLIKDADKYGNMVVSEEKGQYYLINNKGEKLSDVYSSITLSYGYYIVVKDGNKGIIDKDGKEVASCTYSDVKIYENAVGFVAKLVDSNNKNIAFDMDSKKQILSVDGNISLTKNYIMYEANGKKQYYSYENGKMFYEQ